MATAFPPLSPTSRRYTPGEFPTKRFSAVNGAGFTRLFGSKAFNAELDCDFILTDSQLTELLNCYTDAKGGNDNLILPTAMFSGMDSSAFPNYLSWRWAETPSIETVQDGLSRVSVRLIATLEV